MVGVGNLDMGEEGVDLGRHDIVAIQGAECTYLSYHKHADYIPLRGISQAPQQSARTRERSEGEERALATPPHTHIFPCYKARTGLRQPTNFVANGALLIAIYLFLIPAWFSSTSELHNFGFLAECAFDRPYIDPSFSFGGSASPEEVKSVARPSSIVRMSRCFVLKNITKLV